MFNYKKIITPVRGLQILSPSRILLYYRGASFNITMSKLVNSPFNKCGDIIFLSFGKKKKKRKRVIEV